MKGIIIGNSSIGEVSKMLREALEQVASATEAMEEAKVQEGAEEIAEYVQKQFDELTEAVENEGSFEYEEQDDLFSFSEVIDDLDEGEIAHSVSVEGLSLKRSPNGGIVHTSGESISLTPQVLGTYYVIEELEPELVAVPMHVALEAFQNGETIVLEYKDLLNNPEETTSVEINPNAPEFARPFVHFDAVVNGIYYIVK